MGLKGENPLVRKANKNSDYVERDTQVGPVSGTGVRRAILAQTLRPPLCNARLTVEAWHPKKLATSDA